MAEQQRARAAKQASEPSGAGTSTAVASMSTPIFDELLREMAAQRVQADRHAKPVESKHRAP